MIVHSLLSHILYRSNTGPQDMELEPALEPSDIVVTCTTGEEANRPPASDEMVESPERHDSSKYMYVRESIY